MENIVDIFYNELIPEMLFGEVLCDISIRIISNVLFFKNNKKLSAKTPIQCLKIPTLIINYKKRFDLSITNYVTIMKSSNIVNELNISPDKLTKFFIASAIANMSEKDYENPEEYFEKL